MNRNTIDALFFAVTMVIYAVTITRTLYNRKG